MPQVPQWHDATGYVTSLPTSRVIRLVRLLLAVGRVTANLCDGTVWVTGSYVPGQRTLRRKYK